jgi:hypothetical protein
MLHIATLEIALEGKLSQMSCSSFFNISYDFLHDFTVTGRADDCHGLQTAALKSPRMRLRNLIG